MDISRIPDLLQLYQNDVNKTLYGIEKFVKEVLNGSNAHEKLEVSEKIHQLNQLCFNAKKKTLKPTNPKTNICGSVPNEIWIKIIRYLKCKDIFLGFSQVCKRFNALAHDPMAIKSFELLNEKILSAPGEREVLRILRHSKCLKRIVINSENAPHDLLIEEALISNPQLRSVKLINTWIKDDSCSNIVECLTKAKSIEHLEILNKYCGSEPFDNKLLLKIAGIKTLKTLKINLKEVISAFPRLLRLICYWIGIF